MKGFLYCIVTPLYLRCIYCWTVSSVLGERIGRCLNLFNHDSFVQWEAFNSWRSSLPIETSHTDSKSVQPTTCVEAGALAPTWPVFMLKFVVSTYFLFLFEMSPDRINKFLSAWYNFEHDIFTKFVLLESVTSCKTFRKSQEYEIVHLSQGIGRDD